MTRFFLPGIAVLLAFGSSLNAAAVTIVSPSANATVEGNGNNIFPFDIQPPAFNSQRYEQVYKDMNKYIGQVISDRRRYS